MTTSIGEKLASYSQSLKSSSWDLAVSLAVNHKNIPPDLFSQLIHQILADTLSSKFEKKSFVEKALFLIFFISEDSRALADLKDDLNAVFLKIKEICSVEYHPLNKVSKAIFGFLLHGKKEDFNLAFSESGFLLIENFSEGSEDLLFHPRKDAQLGVLSLFYAILTQNSSLLLQAIQLGKIQKAYFEPAKKIFSGVFIKEEEFSESWILFINALFFWILSLFENETGFEELYKNLSSQLKLELKESPYFSSILYPALYAYLEKSKKLNFSSTILEKSALSYPISFEKGLGATFYKYDSLSALFSLSGIGTGFCSLEKNGIEISSIGPQFLPLGEMRKYGLFRTALCKENLFRDLKIDRADSYINFQGWTRLSSDTSEELRPGKGWMHLQALAEKSSLHLAVKWIDFFDSSELYLVFFVKAEKVIIDKTFHLHPHTLDRYEGKSASLSFQKAKGSISVASDSEINMQVIPLSGKDHFWGSQFLVAYHFPKDQTISFQIN